jgi:hypothetical protein
MVSAISGNSEGLPYLQTPQVERAKNSRLDENAARRCVNTRGYEQLNLGLGAPLGYASTEVVASSRTTPPPLPPHRGVGRSATVHCFL